MLERDVPGAKSSAESVSLLYEVMNSWILILASPSRWHSSLNGVVSIADLTEHRQNSMMQRDDRSARLGVPLLMFVVLVSRSCL